MDYERVEILKSNDRTNATISKITKIQKKSSDFFQRMSVMRVLMLPWNKIQDQRYVKVAWWKKLLFINSHHKSNLNFLLSICVYSF